MKSLTTFYHLTFRLNPIYRDGSPTVSFYLYWQIRQALIRLSFLYAKKINVKERKW